MLYFALAIAVYCLLMHNFFDKSVAPLGKRMGHGVMIPFPAEAVRPWIFVATSPYSTSSFMAARKSDWKLEESMGALRVILGITLGMLAKID